MLSEGTLKEWVELGLKAQRVLKYLLVALYSLDLWDQMACADLLGLQTGLVL